MTKRFNRMNKSEVLHFVELNVRDHCHAFRDDAYARAALSILRRVCDTHPAKLIAYVVMPTHEHFIANPADGDIIHLVGKYKSAVTMEIAAIAEAREQQAVLSWLRDTPDGHRQLWQDGKYDFYLYTERLIWQKIDYIHNNPLKAKLVKHAQDYPYSSFRAMYNLEGEIIIPIDREWWWYNLPVKREGEETR